MELIVVKTACAIARNAREPTIAKSVSHFISALVMAAAKQTATAAVVLMAVITMCSTAVNAEQCSVENAFS